MRAAMEGWGIKLQKYFVILFYQDLRPLGRKDRASAGPGTAVYGMVSRPFYKNLHCIVEKKNFRYNKSFYIFLMRKEEKNAN